MKCPRTGSWKFWNRLGSVCSASRVELRVLRMPGPGAHTPFPRRACRSHAPLTPESINKDRESRGLAPWEGAEASGVCKVGWCPQRPCGEAAGLVERGLPGGRPRRLSPRGLLSGLSPPTDSRKAALLAAVLVERSLLGGRLRCLRKFRMKTLPRGGTYTSGSFPHLRGISRVLAAHAGAE